MRPGLAVAAALLTLGVAVAVGGVTPVMVVAVPALFVARRIGPAALNMSGADVALIAATMVAIPLVPWRNPVLRRVLGAIAIYQAVLLVTVVASPSQRAAFEWTHRAALLFGGVSVGAVLADLGRTQRVLRVLMVTAAAVSVEALLQTVARGLQPATPFGMNKNYAGGLLAMCLVVAIAGAPALGLRVQHLAMLRAALFAGLMATQSRGAILAAVIALVLWTLTSGRGVARAVVIVPAAAVLVLVVMLSFRADQARHFRSDFTSENSRRIANQQAEKVWVQHRLFGAGLRYFRDPGYRFDVTSYRDTSLEPHSVWYSTLAESGVVGLCALALLLALTVRAVRPLGSPLADAAILVLVAKLVHGAVDIYWVAGTQTLPWLLVGLAAASWAGRPSELSVLPAADDAVPVSP